MSDPIKRDARKISYFLTLLILLVVPSAILLLIMRQTLAKGNPYLYSLFTKLGLALSIFLIVVSIASFMFFFIKHRKNFVFSIREVVYSKREDIIYQPEAISLKTRVTTVFVIPLSTLLMLQLGLYHIHYLAPYTPTGFVIDTLVPFLISILVNGLVFPRIKPFRDIKPGEIKVVTIYSNAPAVASEVLTFSRNSFSKRLVILSSILPPNIVETIKAHEMEHVREHHILIRSIFYYLNWSLIITSIELTLIYLLVELYPHHFSFTINPAFVAKDGLLLISLILIYLLLLRVTESRADAAAFRAVGKDAYDHVATLTKMFKDLKKDVKPVEIFPFSHMISSFLDRVVHTSSREALRTGDALSSLAQWEIPAVFAFFGSIIEVLRLSSVNLVIFAFPLFFVGMFVVIVLVGLVFLPLTRSYGGTQKGRMNFSFLVSGLYLITDVITLTVIYNFYLALLVLVSGLVLSFLIQKSFLSDMRTAVKTFLITFAVYETINVSLFLIFLGSHLGVF
ncbi:hypothetical protein EWF20_06295 [Sulfolobus sp. S-194]|uniref:M48 family metalloprotease n=1 Tax=Sulfolobus sp. S-194 TaxID=2512240 RepID=UPI001437360D|nr:M48 family metalloprotease [Sulfolobus sp. S-194]QIW23803.1 hypothetical protein EWF20_06295 [Sulfolobus sp. S-194]